MPAPARATATAPPAVASRPTPASGVALAAFALLLLLAASGLVLLVHLRPDAAHLAVDLRDLAASGVWGRLPALHAWGAVVLTLLLVGQLWRRVGDPGGRWRALPAATALVLVVATAGVGAALLRDVETAATGGRPILGRHVAHAVVLPLLVAVAVAWAARRQRLVVRRPDLAGAAVVVAVVTAVALAVGAPPRLPWLAPWAALVPALPGWLAAYALPLVAAATALGAGSLPREGRPAPRQALAAALVLLWLAPLALWPLVGPRLVAPPSLAEWVWEIVLRRPSPPTPLVRELPGLLAVAAAVALPVVLAVRRRAAAAVVALVALLALRAVLTGWLGVGDVARLPEWGIRL